MNVVFDGEGMHLGTLARLSNALSRSISAENPTGAKGQGGMATEGTGAVAARELGRGWKISPCVNLPGNSVVVLADVIGPGSIQHIWMTVKPAHWRQLILRLFWDHEETPSVEVPYGDLFCNGWCVPCIVNSLPIAVNPAGGFNSYWEMPFRQHARMTIQNLTPDEVKGFYYQIDYYRFGRELPEEFRTQRFHAQFRFENPCEHYGRNYLFLDATGRGALVGLTLGIQINEPQVDWFVHGGGDSVLIDGESRSSVLHGIGLEDYFGQSWGVAPFQSPYAGCTYSGGGKIAIYRFYVAEPVVFHSSIRATMGALANGYSSVAYWYQEEPHKPFFRVPGADDRMPDTVARYGTYDMEPPSAAEWKLLAPIRIDEGEPFEKERALEKKETGEEEFSYEPRDTGPTLPGGDKMVVRWKPQKAYHNFLDFNLMARPAIGGIRPQGSVVGYALRYLNCAESRDVSIRVGFDDEVAVRVNGRVVFKGKHPNGFADQVFKARLKKGANRILVKLSNYDNNNWKSWAFSFHIEH